MMVLSSRLSVHIMAFLATLILLLAGYAQAQQRVTDDDVAEVARRMYCPICENEPLSDCRAITCMEWKEEIRIQLEEGRDADTIIADFVSRYGQHVSGVPLDPFLRAMSLVTPWLAAALIFLIGVLTFRRWQSQRPQTPEPELTPETHDDDIYRQMLERDLKH